MFSSKLTCSNCNREVEETDKIAIVVQAKELNGITNLKSFAKKHKVLCSQCNGIRQ
ncbi:hypothetical protein KFZ56_12970 [Virgibacillus sp. NKC19-3]|uniref:hypothetical protein n=1 Tax=Virgibacillus saliphilus TaxID=2831674 RepID=UPI001C9A35F2|nr:hypothetical protein [Virgibacillus sp. NKC19-3]MBY7143942.1 hypothetical protein [Virgibacillus sp. NKC19-3]